MKRNWIKKAGYLYFITNTVIKWVPVFIYKETINLIYETLSFFHRKRDVEFFHYVIMPNHLHYTCYIPEGNYNISDFQRDFKNYLSRNVRAIIENNKELELVKIFRNRSDLERLPTFSDFYHSPKKRNHEFSLWRSDDKPILIENEKMFEQKMNYIHLNPVRKGYVEAISDYPFSSASEYGKSLIPLEELNV